MARVFRILVPKKNANATDSARKRRMQLCAIRAGQESESNATSPHLDRFSSSGASQGHGERPFRNPQEEAEALDRAKQVRA